MLKFEGIKEFDIEKLDSKSDFSRNFQIIFSDDTLDEDESEIIERELMRHDFNIKDEKVNFEVIYNVDLDKVTIAITIHCPLIHNNQIQEEMLYKFMKRHRADFEEYYEHIKPY
ncbi:MAG: hypothetical protein ACXVH2_03730 [Methanobacterium sp.]